MGEPVQGAFKGIGFRFGCQFQAYPVFPDKPLRRWYLAKALQINNYWQLIIEPNQIDFTARDNEGNPIDQLSVSADQKAFPKSNQNK